MTKDSSNHKFLAISPNFDIYFFKKLSFLYCRDKKKDKFENNETYSILPIKFSFYTDRTLLRFNFGRLESLLRAL